MCIVVTRPSCRRTQLNYAFKNAIIITGRQGARRGARRRARAVSQGERRVSQYLLRRRGVVQRHAAVVQPGRRHAEVRAAADRQAAHARLPRRAARTPRDARRRRRRGLPRRPLDALEQPELVAAHAPHGRRTTSRQPPAAPLHARERAPRAARHPPPPHSQIGGQRHAGRGFAAFGEGPPLPAHGAPPRRAPPASPLPPPRRTSRVTAPRPAQRPRSSSRARPRAGGAAARCSSGDEAKARRRSKWGGSPRGEQPQPPAVRPVMSRSLRFQRASSRASACLKGQGKVPPGCKM